LGNGSKGFANKKMTEIFYGTVFSYYLVTLGGHWTQILGGNISQNKDSSLNSYPWQI